MHLEPLGGPVFYGTLVAHQNRFYLLWNTMQKNYAKLLAGYQKFKKTYYSDRKDHLSQLEKEGQTPYAMVISCSDSRVDPALILGADFGDLFVVRNVANIVPPYNEHAYQGTAAALQFGIQQLGLNHLVIVGHSSCAGIQTLVNQKDDNANAIARWVARVGNARAKGISADECAQKALHISREHCLSYPWIAEKVNADQLMIHRWFFSLGEGTITRYCTKEDSFIPL